MDLTHREARTADCNFNGGRGAEAHDAIDHVAWLERKPYVRQLAGECGAQPLFQFFGVNSGARLQLDGEPAFLRTAIPLVDQIDGIVRSMDANEANRDGDVVLPDCLPDLVE